MAWESLVLMMPAKKQSWWFHRNRWICPKCNGAQVAIPFASELSRLFRHEACKAGEQECAALFCDRCGELIAFDGCRGRCAQEPKEKCEVCGKYYCHHCGITIDFEADGGCLQMRYCNDHIPEWFRNR